MSDSLRPLDLGCQAPLSMGFSRQEYWSGLPFPSPGDLPDPGIEPASPVLAGGFFATEPPRKTPPQWLITVSKTSPKVMRNASNFIMLEDLGSQESRWNTVGESVSALWASGRLRSQPWCFSGWALGWPGGFHQMSKAPVGCQGKPQLALSTRTPTHDLSVSLGLS